MPAVLPDAAAGRLRVRALLVDAAATAAAGGAASGAVGDLARARVVHLAGELEISGGR